MKKIILYISIIGLLNVLTACEKNQMMDYHGNEGIYFSVRHGNSSLNESGYPYQPYSLVEFVRINRPDTLLSIKVQITGPTKDYDRPFTVEINPDSTTAEQGVHYEALPESLVIPAGAIEGEIPIRVFRTPDLQHDQRTIGLRLIKNKHFELAFPQWDALPELTSGTIVPEFDASLHTIRLNDIMVEPEVWLGSLQDGNRESGLMGVFTREKMELLTDLFGVTYEDFMSEESMPLVRSVLIANDASQYLIERYNAGDPVLEADGRLMFIGSVPWTSYLGVPWVPGS